MIWSARLACAVPAALAIAACAPAGKSVPLTALGFETRRLEDTVQDCPEHLAPCASIVLEYPEIVGPAPPAVTAGLAAFIDSTVFAPIAEGDSIAATRDPEALMRQFLGGYLDFVTSFPEAPGAWTLQREAAAIWSSPEAFSLEYTESSYTGGAHPNTFVRLATFDARTGGRLRLSDLIDPGHDEALRVIGERAFRTAHGLGDADDLVGAGFWFEEGRFRLNDNFAVTAEGLRFHYDPYEVASYAVGPTDITLSRDALSAIARPGGMLAAAAPG
jgi:hypothetical protein